MVQPDCNVMVVPHGRDDEGGLHVHAHNDWQLLVCTSDCHFTRATKVFDPFSEPTSTPVEQIQRIVSFLLPPKANSKSTISSRDCRTLGGNEIPTTQSKCTLVALSAATNTSLMALSDSFYNCCVSESEAICMCKYSFFCFTASHVVGKFQLRTEFFALALDIWFIQQYTHNMFTRPGTLREGAEIALKPLNIHCINLLQGLRVLRKHWYRENRLVRKDRHTLLANTLLVLVGSFSSKDGQICKVLLFCGRDGGTSWDVCTSRLSIAYGMWGCVGFQP